MSAAAMVAAGILLGGSVVLVPGGPAAAEGGCPVPGSPKSPNVENVARTGEALAAAAAIGSVALGAAGLLLAPETGGASLALTAEALAGVSIGAGAGSAVAQAANGNYGAAALDAGAAGLGFGVGKAAQSLEVPAQTALSNAIDIARSGGLTNGELLTQQQLAQRMVQMADAQEASGESARFLMDTIGNLGTGAFPGLNLLAPESECSPTDGLNNLQDQGVIYAPDIYLYPPTLEPVIVTLGGTVLASAPAYTGFWRVLVSPSGAIAGAGGHLFYEAAAQTSWQASAGWVVPAADWPAWISAMLPRLGLNARETADFARDWGHDLPPAPFYLVAPQPAALVDAAVPLHVQPRPDVLYRLWLDVVPLRAPVDVPPPVVPALNRHGFTVVEWGVVFPPGVTPPCKPEIGSCP